MSAVRAIISGTGIISALGSGWVATRNALEAQRVAIGPLSLFPTPHDPPLPAGEVRNRLEQNALPRTHQLAQIAAAQAFTGRLAPDAIVVGTTTGGLLTTEALLKQNVADPSAYCFHSPATVAETIAKQYGCRGPVLTVSTACSSGAVALKIALELIRNGRARRVLAGGADNLCRLIYHGFNALQLIDPKGARPLDRDRRGMSVAEGAAFLMLEADDGHPNAVALLGAGLSCDAFHPTAPHPDGKGAMAAMTAAIEDAGLNPETIDYINLHGTGTLDNDLSEARAVRTLFKNKTPMLSSVKGAMGHSLGAAGAMEAVIATNCVHDQWIPGNVGLSTPDPALNLTPIMRSKATPVRTVLSNSLGFGGNNAAVVIGDSRIGDRSPAMNTGSRSGPLTILGSACITGAGHTDETLKRFTKGRTCNGKLALDLMTRFLSPKRVRRLKRLPRLTLALAEQAHSHADQSPPVESIFMGTGWGALSETYRFLTRLFETDEQFPSPTDFIGSVHNAPAGQAAMMFNATGANVTTTGGDVSFEQALMAAELVCGGDTALVIGADEAHDKFSPLLDPSVGENGHLSDGGGALLVKPGSKPGGVSIHLAHYEPADDPADDIAHGLAVTIDGVIDSLGSADRLHSRIGFILAGIPAAQRTQGDRQLDQFRERTRFTGPVIDYRPIIGEFASASAVAAVLSARFTAEGVIPGGLSSDDQTLPLNGKGGLVLGLGRWVTAMEVVLQ